MDLPAEGYSVLAALSSLCRLSLGRAAYWPAVLSELTTLRYLDLHSCGWRMGPAASGQAMQERLEGISSGLTGLCLQSGLPQLPAPGAALSDSLQLQLLLDERPTFQPAHWPDSLRAAWATWRQLLKEPLGPGITPELRYLSIQYCWSTNWSLAAQQPSWAALWAWLERAPNLRLLEVRVGSWKGVAGGGGGMYTGGGAPARRLPRPAATSVAPPLHPPAPKPPPTTPHC